MSHGSRSLMLALVATFAMALALAPYARAEDSANVDDGPDSIDGDRVLEIPQQCTRDGSAMACRDLDSLSDRDDDPYDSDPDSVDSDPLRNSVLGDDSAASNSDPTSGFGTLEDYENQEIDDPPVLLTGGGGGEPWTPSPAGSGVVIAPLVGAPVGPYGPYGAFMSHTLIYSRAPGKPMFTPMRPFPRR